MLNNKVDDVKVFWDPVGDIITANSFEDSISDLKEKITIYESKPYLVVRNLILIAIPGIIIIVICIFPGGNVLFFKPENYIFIGMSIVLLILYLSIIGMPFIYIAYIRDLQRDIIKMMVASEFNWVYSPLKNESRWEIMKNKIPFLFDIGDKSQNFQDEFWGKFKSNKQESDFWIATFEYTIKGGKYGTDTKQYETIFGVNLPKHIRTNFALTPKGSIDKIYNLLSNKKINTGSLEFNKAFSFFYGGKKKEKEKEILQIISPVVQMKLLDLLKAEGKYSISFQKEMIILSYDGRILDQMNTNFFLKTRIHPSDKQRLVSKLKNLLNFSIDIVSHIE